MVVYATMCQVVKHSLLFGLSFTTIVPLFNFKATDNRNGVFSGV
jgi:hypothetical protein